MLWALASSAFVIYLYRKLNADEASGPATPAWAASHKKQLPEQMSLGDLRERVRASATLKRRTHLRSRRGRLV
jgi:hypothetical protein